MRYKEPRPMKQIHDIRIALREEKKGLSSQQKVSITNQIAKRLIQDHNLEIKQIPSRRVHREAGS
jgi:hypothetical protein